MKAALWLVPLLLVPQEDAEKQKRVAQLLAWSADKDAEVSQSARARLVEIGRDAVPAIEKKLGDLGALPLANVLREIDRRSSPAAEPYALPADEALVDVKVDKDMADKYVRVKYGEALGWAKKGNFQKGFDIASAIHHLEPRSSIAEKVNQLRRYCENKITQTTLIEAKLVPEKPAIQAGEPAAVTMRLKNLFRNMMNLKYEGAEGKVPEGLVVIEIEAGIRTLEGASTTANRHQEFSFEGEISLAPQGSWERRFLLDTALGLPGDSEVQTLVVNAWTQPSKIDTEGVNITRRLQFDTLEVKLVPKRYAHFIEKPLEWLSKTIETDRPAQETWICAQLLAGDDKKKGTEVLVRSMAKTESAGYRGALGTMLENLTGEKSCGADPKKWSDWMARQAAEPKKKK